MSVDRMPLSHARTQLAGLLKHVEEAQRPVVLEHGGREVGALLPMHIYRALIEQREMLWEAFDRAGERMPSYSEEELEEIIQAAVAEARGKRRRAQS